MTKRVLHTAQALSAAVVVLLVILALNWDRPDPAGVVQAKLLSSAADLAKDAQAKLGDADHPEDARKAFNDAHLEVASSRVVEPDRVEWDLIVGGGAEDKYIARGTYRTFHTCFRLSGHAGSAGSITRTDIPCPPGINGPQRTLLKSALLHLPNKV